MNRAATFFLSCIALALPVAAFGQGVPVTDTQQHIQREAIIGQADADLTIQKDKFLKAQRLLEIQQEQLDELKSIHSALTLGDTNVAGTIDAIEAGTSEETAAETLYATEDSNPGAPQMFGDASGTVEELIIKVAKETHGLAGVGKAGLSVVQWRCLLQALIWQESRFSIGAKSPVGAFGLTQIMPGTASDLGIFPGYYDSPYLQVTGGARYLAKMLNMFGGNVIHALAGYNAGPGNVQKYGGVPPFKETQHYVQVIPERYNHYLATVGGIDALGTIEPGLLANSNVSLTGAGASYYANNALASLKAMAERTISIIERIETTSDVHEALSLNTLARAELGRAIAMWARLQSVNIQPLSAEQIATAAAMAAERRYMDFTLEDL
ncbi:lytic transglycosylase domain-containing protein [Notoacmeibacter ruber]|uniref:Lytic transglycosylase domain-containing protein n=1 Tax=Notoacmeibacter ruber TaxID=2670375 RepID=A0A3L7J3B6_9HYPH|nr:lytic transglycosylase domain-containing protein [Notoacmeibacter ruber]RLQ84959.1 lytic transglycosylase domain-containing protein [Notoacmeibacter ruber]